MFRINLIKITAIFLLIPQLVFGAYQEGEKIILDEKGNPIPFALVKVDGQKPMQVDESGQVISPSTGERVMIFALGYETQQLTWEEWLASEKNHSS